MKKPKRKLMAARAKLQQDHPHRTIPDDWFRTGRVLAAGRPVLNPDALVPAGITLVVMERPSLRGGRKLAAALNAFDIDVGGLACLDLGASAGGFTCELLSRGARRIYAVDAGHGQLRGALRQDPRVINLERTNVADLSSDLVPEPIDLVTADLSYLALGTAVNQLTAVALAPCARLVGLVKPQFELGLATMPESAAEHHRAIENAATGLRRAGWGRVRVIRSPHRGARGAVEFLMAGVRE